jgi:ATP/maltotriose-dependent transcriptional regulator MalT
MKLQLDELNATMSELETRTKEATEEARDKYKAEIGKLRQQSQLVIDKLDELKAAGEESWKDLVAGTEKVRDAFIHSYHDFRSQL